MKKRINRAAICSSDNYEQSKIIHRNYLNEQHNVHREEIITLTANIISETVYVRVFGKLVKINREIAIKAKMTIID